MRLSRSKYYIDKLRRAWTDGTLSERVGRKLRSTVTTRIGSLNNYLRLDRKQRQLSLADGFKDHLAHTRTAVPERILERIAAAYLLAKSEQEAAPEQYQIRGLWAEWIEINYGDLIATLRSGNTTKISAILSNFAREPFAVGTGASYDDLVHYKNSIFGNAYLKTVWWDYRNKLVESGFDLDTLKHPNVGNPAGFSLNGGVVPIEALRHAHNGFAIKKLLSDISNPVVVEIGGGFGGQAYQTLYQCQTENRIGRYYDFDIPEVLVVVSYFLLLAFPEMNIRLFGEGSVTADDFDIGLFPHFAIDQLADVSVDLVFNTNSFSEMDAAASGHYLNIVNQVCRRYFMHVNHEVRFNFAYADGTISTNLIGSEMIPDTALFKRIYKRPRLFQRPEDKPFESYAYLYERIS